VFVKNRERLPVIVFFVLAYGITWICWISSMLVARAGGYLLPTMANFFQLRREGFEGSGHLWTSVLFSFAVYGPLIGAVVASLLEKRSSSERAGDGVRDRRASSLLRQMVSWRVRPVWYLIIIGIAFILAIVPRLLGEVTGQMASARAAAAADGAYGAALTLPVLIFLFLQQTVTSGLGEEPGWRGYLLAFLQRHLNKERVIWVLGILWALWHYPITIYYTLQSMVDVSPAAAVFTLVMALAGQTISLVGMTYIYVWIMNRTGSLLLAILFHGLSNFFPGVLLIGAGPQLGIVTAVMPWIVVFVLERKLGKENFPGDRLQVRERGAAAEAKG
jgi:uncharacterized protein